MNTARQLSAPVHMVLVAALLLLAPGPITEARAAPAPPVALIDAGLAAPQPSTRDRPPASTRLANLPGPPTSPQLTENTKLIVPGGAADGYFGSALALSGDTAVVRTVPRQAPYSGSVFVFRRLGSSWAPEAELVPRDRSDSDMFGISVAISGDTVIVGAYSDSTIAEYSGAAYVFTRSGSSWHQQAKLIAPDAAPADYFGRSVAVDADTAVIGSHLNDDAGSGSGSAYVYTRHGITWSLTQKLTASDAKRSAFFGWTVAIDGDTLVVGANRDWNPVPWIMPGAAYVFRQEGSLWSQEAKLTPSDFDINYLSLGFAESVDVSGNTVVVGTQRNGTFRRNSGAAYIYTRSGSTWTEQPRVTTDNALGADLFGRAAAVFGNTLVVGAQSVNNRTTNRIGSAYVYRHTGTSWPVYAVLGASDAQPVAAFGGTVAVDGTTILVGAPYHTNQNGMRTGAVYVYELSSDTSPPEIIINGGDVALECSLDTYTELGATAIDDVDGDISAAVVIGGDTVDPSAPGTYVVTYNVSDGAGNAAAEAIRTVTVADSTPPMITLIGGDMAVECSAPYVEPGAIATDLCDGPLEVSISGSVDVGMPGTYIILYSATDSAGNAATETRTVTVEDTTAPDVTAELVFVPGDDDEDLASRPTDDDEDDDGRYRVESSATDACDPNPSVSSLILLPELVDPSVKFKTKSKSKIKIDLTKNKVKVEGPDPEGLWADVLAVGGIAVEQSQLLKIELEGRDDDDKLVGTLDEDSAKLEFKFDRDGGLEKISGSVGVTLESSATDASGNTGVAHYTLEPPKGEEDA